METADSVDFHFDVMCPWAYQTSLWIRSVRENWSHYQLKFFSLEEVNLREGKKHPWEREWSYGWSMMRIGAYLRRTSMDDLDRWYARAGRALHVDGHKPHEPDVARHLLEEIGLDPSIVDAAIADESTTMRFETTTIGLLPQAGTVSSTSMAIAIRPVLLDPPSWGGCCSTLGSGVTVAEFLTSTNCSILKLRSMSALLRRPSVHISRPEIGINQPRESGPYRLVKR